MTDLKNANAQKCMELLKDFIESVDVAGTDGNLIAKKEKATAALTQLSTIMNTGSVMVADGGVTCVDKARGC